MLLLASSVCGLFKWRQFEPEVILLAVGWYLRFSLSYRDVEELLAERGLRADHVTVWRWVQRYAPELQRRLRSQHCPPVRPLGTGSSEWPVIVPSDHEIPERVITISQKRCNLGVAILYTLMKNGHAASGKVIAEPMRHDGRVSLAQPRNLIMTNNYSGNLLRGKAWDRQAGIASIGG
jgi:hypothetical protein